MKPFFQSFRATLLALSLTVGGVAISQPAFAAPLIEEKNWVYYTKDGEGIYKNKIDGKQQETRITDDNVYGDIFVDDDWIYYMNITGVPSPSGLPQAGYIYKIKTNGSDKTKVSDDVVSSIGYYKNYLYYSYLGKKNADGSITRTPDKIYRVSTSGKGKKEILKERSYSLQVDGGYIYFVNDEKAGDLYKAKTDGDNKKYVKKSEAVESGEHGFNIYDDWIAYQEEGDTTPKIMTTSGKDIQELPDDAEVIGFKKDYVYYTKDNVLFRKDAEDDDSDEREVMELPDLTIIGYDLDEEETIIQESDGSISRLSFDDDYGDQTQVKKLTLSPSETEIRDGGTESISLIATYGNGKTEDVASKATWTSTKPSVAYFQNGKIKAIKRGTTTIKASFGGKTDSIKVKVVR